MLTVLCLLYTQQRTIGCVFIDKVWTNVLFSAITVPTTTVRIEPRPLVTADAERRYGETNAVQYTHQAENVNMRRQHNLHIQLSIALTCASAAFYRVVLAPSDMTYVYGPHNVYNLPPMLQLSLYASESAMRSRTACICWSRMRCRSASHASVCINVLDICCCANMSAAT